MKLKKEEGQELVKAAREAINYYFENRELPSVLKGVDLDNYQDPRGVFVTIKLSGQLRGCIGVPLPMFPLGKAVVKSAIGAAFEDYRFPPLSREEFEEAEIEVSVLSVPEKIEVSSESEYPERIKIGRDGLIIKYGGQTGLLLPQVPVEEGWGTREYLDHLCLKAGLPRDAWKRPGAVIEAFQAQIFEERR